MSTHVTQFTKNKTYGKLIFNIVKLLKKNVVHLEKPLNHIVGNHSSIWKTKILKIFSTHIEDSFLTQSFRIN